MTGNGKQKSDRTQCLCGTSRKTLNEIAEDVRFIKENYTQMRNISMVWGFMGGIIPSIIIIIISILKLVMGDGH